MPISVLLVDDHALVRDAIRTLLEPEDDIEVVGEASNGADAIQAAIRLRPDVAVVDIALKDLSGIDVTRRIVEGSPSTRVLAVSMHSSREFVAEMLKAGARGYLVKDQALEVVLTAVRIVARGGVFLGETVANVVVDDYVHRLSGGATKEEPNSPLTARETEVLRHIAAGHTTKQIASVLGVSAKTIETHRRQIMEKTGIFSVVGLVKYALRLGLTTLDD